MDASPRWVFSDHGLNLVVGFLQFVTFFWFLGLGADSDVDWIDMRIGRCRERIVRSWLEFGLDVVKVLSLLSRFLVFWVLVWILLICCGLGRYEIWAFPAEDSEILELYLVGGFTTFPSHLLIFWGLELIWM